MLSTDHPPKARRSSYKLIVKQQPIHARLCSFKEKVDRRPIDPPPIIQLKCESSSTTTTQHNYLQSPFFFLVSSLQAADDYDLESSRIDCNRTTAGTVVQSLHKLKDIDGSDAGFFIFPDISVRVEGFFRLRFTLFEIDGPQVVRLTSTLSDVFQVYSPKLFPGMAESTLLTRYLSDQGMRIRIRKENRIQISKRKRSEEGSDDDKRSYSQPPSPVTSDSHPSPPCVTPDQPIFHYAKFSMPPYQRQQQPYARSASPPENHLRLPPLKHILETLPNPHIHFDLPHEPIAAIRSALPPMYSQSWPSSVPPYGRRSHPSSDP